jgi:predicted DNA-binding transcriptional regulator AlpA
MPIEDAGETWYTVTEAAKLLGMSRQGVDDYIRRYELPVRLFRDTRFIAFGTVAWIKKHNKK